MQTRSRELLAVGIFGSASPGDRIEMLLKRVREFSPRASLARVGASAVVLLMLTIAGAFAPRWIAFAQQPDRPSFEVASVKPGDPGSSAQGPLFMRPGGRFVCTNGSIQMLLGFAYDLRPHQISGVPSRSTRPGSPLKPRRRKLIRLPPHPKALPASGSCCNRCWRTGSSWWRTTKHARSRFTN